MSKVCTFVPSKGAGLFKQLSRQFEHSKAVELFYTAINPDFISNYSTLSLDEDGVPTYKSLMLNNYFKGLIKGNDLILSIQKNYDAVEDNLDNYLLLLLQAFDFNNTSDFKDKFIALVKQLNNGNIRIIITPKNSETEELFRNLYASNVLNLRLSDIFSDLGISIGLLTLMEIEAGRVGVTDFNIARKTAVDFSSLIRVANNMEGALAIGEEFAHMIIGALIDKPLIQRSIKALASKPELIRELLGDEYVDDFMYYDGDMDTLAEEALGRILQDNLLSQTKGEQSKLIERTLNNIVNQFKDYDLQDIADALAEAETAMSTLAKDILDGNKKINKEDLIKNSREKRLNALSSTIDRNIEILKKAEKIELKRYKITTGEIREQANDVLLGIKRYLLPGADTVFGLLNYALGAAQELRHLLAEMATLDTQDIKTLFKILKKVKLYIDSYGGFINDLTKAISEDKELEALIADYNAHLQEGQEANQEFSDLLRGIEINGQTISVAEVMNQLNALDKELVLNFYRKAKKGICEFFKPFLGSNVTILTGEHAGELISVEALLDLANSDISFLDRWLDSMADSADTLLQLFDSAVKKSRDKARIATLDNIAAIQKLRMDAEKMGITSFDWMFETDDKGNKTGNYISEINYGLYEKDKKEFIAAMDEKYGKNPTGEEADKKIKEMTEWKHAHGKSILGQTMPNPAIYTNKKYLSLTKNQREILNRYMSMKAFFDKKLPNNRVAKLKAILIRKSGSQRVLNSLANPSSILENIKLSLANSYLDTADDDQTFGNKKSALTLFDGREFMTLPVLFTNRLEDPNELSTDIFSGMMQYAYMANNYELMDDILDLLEVARTVVENPDERKVLLTRGGEELIERFNVKNEKVKNLVIKRLSNIVAKLNDFFESQVYGRYLKDLGTFEFLGKKVNIQKLTSRILSHSSVVQLGLNFLANLANVTTGIAMLNIEAAAHNHFSAKELLKADAAYTAAMKDVMAELTDRNKKSKLELFDLLFDIKLDFGNRVRGTLKKSWFERIFGASWAFIGQEAGDHWLYNRTAIAMAIRKQVLLNGRKMSLWDALKPKNKFEGNNKIKELNYREITELDGSPLDIHKFGRQVAHVNHTLFGIYNKDDANAANRLALGRLLMQYRKWIKPQMNVRFLAGQYNNIMDEWEEGYYRTVYRLAKDLVRGKIQFGSISSLLKDFEKANIRKVVTELVLLAAICCIANLIEWPDDKKRPWAIKLAEYSAKRLLHETGGLAPSTIMYTEMKKTITDPLPSLGVVLDLFNFVNSSITPSDWDNELASGPYKGYSTLEKNAIKLPIPGMLLYRLIDKFINELDNSISYYARPAY